MRIGIDVDDTIVYSWEACIPYYAKLFNKDISELKKSRPYYSSVSDKCSIEEYFEIIGNTYEKAACNAKVKEDASFYIKKLHDEGNKIIFITSRKLGYEDAYKYTKKFLDKNGFIYDKLVVNASNKAIVCKKEKIDIFIDDSIVHCDEVRNLGVDVIMMGTNYNKSIKRIKRIRDWNKIYDYIVSR